MLRLLRAAADAFDGLYASCFGSPHDRLRRRAFLPVGLALLDASGLFLEKGLGKVPEGRDSRPRDLDCFDSSHDRLRQRAFLPVGLALLDASGLFLEKGLGKVPEGRDSRSRDLDCFDLDCCCV